MFKKIVKYALLVLMVIGVVIATANFVDSNLESNDGVGEKVTYYPSIPDCSGDPKDCYDFTR